MTGLPPDPVLVRRGVDQAPRVVMPYLVSLRWASVVALATAAWAAHTFWRIRLPVTALVALLAALAATNAALAFQLRSPSPRHIVIAGVLIVDVGLLAAILYLVGGPLNPFGIVFLVGITVAAVALGHRWAIAIGMLSNVAYGVTYFYHRPLDFIDPAYSGAVLTLHLSGMWAAFFASTALIAYFVGRVSEALGEREQELSEARAAAAKSERLAALFALGAGAAHELATPLSTIRTVAGELERRIAHTPGHPLGNDADDIAVIRDEVDRCTRVLDQLSGRSAATSAADMQTPLTDVVDELRYRLGESLSQRLDVSLPAGPRLVGVPAEPLRQAIIALVRNAFDASATDQRVTLRFDGGPGLRIEVADHGRGMTDEEAARAVEPFFTTKAPGAGLGLGLFLVRAFVDQMGGTMRLSTVPGGGTTVVLELPVRA